MPKSTQRSRYRYLLGDTRTEASRLRAQARLWDPTALALFDRLGVARGWRVLELGPGQGSLHLELRRRVQQPIDAVEPSPAFTRRLRSLCARDGFGQGRIWQSTLADAALPRDHYDLVFARWVFLFLPRPETHVRTLAASLKPGGLLAIQDYHRDTFVMIPTPKEWAAFLRADHAFFASQGGDASIAGRLPEIYEQIGLNVVDVFPNIKTGHPASPVWTWISTYFFGVMDRLAAFPPFTPAQAARLRKHWLAAAERPASLLIAPAVIDVVGRRPRRS
jgi:SAM-dependent methyltransferase